MYSSKINKREVEKNCRNRFQSCKLKKAQLKEMKKTLFSS